jgi:hypothetical protein
MKISISLSFTYWILNVVTNLFSFWQLYKVDHKKSEIEQMRDLVYTLALYLENETVANQILAEFTNFVSGKKDNATAIEDFFLR